MRCALPPEMDAAAVGDALAPHLRRLSAIDNGEDGDSGVGGEDSGPVVACDLLGAGRFLADWRARFPRVHASTSAHALGSRPLARLLAASGRVSFRAFSRSDLDAAVSAGIPGQSVLVANPCKTRGLMAHARRLGAGVAAFDSEPELDRLAKAWPEVELLLLLAPPQAGAPPDGRRRQELGARPAECPRLLAAARRRGLRVVGVAVWLGDADVDDAVEWASAAAWTRELLAMAGDGACVVDLGQVSPTVLAHRVLPAFAAAFGDEASPRLLCDLTPGLLAASVVMATRVVAKAIESPAGCHSYQLSGSGHVACLEARLCGWVGGGDWPEAAGASAAVPSRLAEGCEPLTLPELRVGDWLLWRGLRACPAPPGRLLHCLLPPTADPMSGPLTA